LNPLAVRRLEKPGLHADGNGLYLSVSKTGAKSWAYVYTRANKRVELGLGPIHAVSLAQAREKAQEAASLRARGVDPKMHWRQPADEETVTFGMVALDLIDTRKSGWRNAKHRQQWRNTLETYGAPIWDRAVDQISVDDVLGILRPIWTSKQETATRVRGRIEAVLDAAKVRKLRVGENPAAWRGNLSLLLPKPRKGPRRHQPAMAHTDLPHFIGRLRKREGLAARALELLIHTATRTSEVLQARWSEFDLDGALWVIPAGRMKAGKEHRVPLSECALKLLKSLPRTSDFVFPGAKADKPLSNMALAMVLRRMKIEDATVHGFRSSFRDWAADIAQTPREIAEAALAHQVGSEVERAYRRGDALRQRRELMVSWSAYLLATPAASTLNMTLKASGDRSGANRTEPDGDLAAATESTDRADVAEPHRT
jgi:integrase